MKKRVEGGPEPAKLDGASRNAFVELDVRPPTSPGGCVVVLEHGAGPRMRIELEGGRVDDLVAMVGAFCSLYA